EFVDRLGAALATLGREQPLDAWVAALTAALDALTAWAWRNGVELAGIEVGPPSLEDAYLALVGEAPATQPESHQKHEKEVSSHGRTG
ncbi:MAG TPA: hypothetical protein VGA45_21300, partial [Actinomycetota bacterium]